VRILITAKDEVSGQLDKIRDKASLLSKTDIGKGMAMGVGIAGLNMMKGAAMGALDAVTTFASGSVSAFRDEEVEIARLGASLQANIKDWDGNTDAIERQLTAMVKTTGFGDGEMRDSLSRIVAATKDVGKAFEVQSVAMDLARFKGISLADASDALIKVEAGQYRALKGLGIVLKEGATQTEALAAVQKVAGGQMAAYAETAAGKTEILNKRLGEMQEELGARLSPALETATAKVLGLMDALDSSNDMTFPDRMVDIADVVNALNPAMWSANIGAGVLRDGMDKAGDAAAAAAAEGAEAWDTGSERIAGSLGAVASASEETTGSVVKDNREITRSYQKTADYLLDKYTSDIDTALGIVEGRSDLHAAKTDEDRIEAYADLAKLGALSEKDFENWLDILERMAKGTKGKVHAAYLAAIRDVQALKAAASGNIDVKVEYHSKTPRGGRNVAYAAGGPAAPYQEITVGEYRPETIRLGAVGGMVNPSASSSGGGGGAVSLTINVSTPVMTPGAAQALADAIAPSITRWQQGRALIGNR
jgi:hypothetical protein